jgi:hypothetical protein
MGHGTVYPYFAYPGKQTVPHVVSPVSYEIHTMSMEFACHCITKIEIAINIWKLLFFHAIFLVK